MEDPWPDVSFGLIDDGALAALILEGIALFSLLPLVFPILEVPLNVV